MFYISAYSIISAENLSDISFKYYKCFKCLYNFNNTM